MANDLTKNPWLLDTASTTAVLTTLRIRVRHLHWEGPSAGDILILKDASGRTVCTVKSSDGQDQDLPNLADGGGQEWAGLIAYQIPHGTVALTYR